MSSDHVAAPADTVDGGVLLECLDGVATLTLDRPDCANALDLPTAQVLTDHLRAVATDPAVKVVRLRGSGRIFCGGGDLAGMLDADDRPAAVKTLAETCHEAVLLLARMDKVVVAQVQGSAAGAGLSLVLAADLVVAARGAKFLTAYAMVGLTPDCGQSWLLPQVVGLRRALELTLTNRALNAEEALDWGLVTEVVDPEALDVRAGQLARLVAEGAPEARGRARSLLRWPEPTFAAHLDREAATIAEAAGSDAALLLMRARLRRS